MSLGMVIMEVHTKRLKKDKQATDGKKIFAIIYVIKEQDLEHMGNSQTKKYNQKIDKNMNRHFIEDDIQMTINTWSDVQHHLSLGKYKLKPQ